jgi:site-specific DNA-methyltransferase (adenine-specific)
LPYGCLHPERKRDTEKWYDSQSQARGSPWDVKLNLEEFWIQVKRLCKKDNTPVLMFCNTKFGVDLINSNPSWFRYDIVWDKARGVSFLSANKKPMKSHEMIYVFSKKGAFYKRIDEDGHCALSVVTFRKSHPRGAHPTEKPMELYKWLLPRYCPEGGTVLDPTAGSFNAIVAARDLGLKGIGIEKDDAYFEKANKKLNPESADTIEHA